MDIPISDWILAANFCSWTRIARWGLEMKRWIVALIIALLPIASASISENNYYNGPRGGGSLQSGVAIGVLGAGQEVFTFNYPETIAHIGETAEISVDLWGPQFTSFAVSQISMSMTFVGTNCAATTIARSTPTLPFNGNNDVSFVQVQQSAVIAPGSGESHFMWRNKIIVTGTTCSGILSVAACQGVPVPPDTVAPCTIVLGVTAVPVSIHVIDQRNDNQNRLCDASLFNTTCNNPEIDNQNRLCANSAFGASCAPPTATIAVASMPTLNVITCTVADPCHLITNGQSNTTFTGNITIPSTVNINANVNQFDWAGLIMQFIPLLLALLLAFWYVRRGDILIGIIAMALLAHVIFAYSWGPTTILILVCLLLYLVYRTFTARRQIA
jgi:hypothetical protein